MTVRVTPSGPAGPPWSRRVPGLPVTRRAAQALPEAAEALALMMQVCGPLLEALGRLGPGGPRGDRGDPCGDTTPMTTDEAPSGAS